MRRPRLSTAAKAPHLIRFRLTLWYTGLAAVVLAAFVGGVFYAFNQYQQSAQSYIDVLRQTFKNQVELTFPPPGYGNYIREQNPPLYGLKLKNPDATNQSGYPMAFYKADGTALTDKVPSSAVAACKNPAANRAKNNAVKQAKSDKQAPPAVTDTKSWRCITLPLSIAGQAVIGQIGVPIDHIQDQMNELKRILTYVAGVLLVISAIGGWLLAGRALKPIDELTRRAQQISASDLSQRLNLDQEDELGRLGATFDDLIARLQEAFERQKRFTSDASHELRTPLTVMQADIGLALARPRSAEEYRETLISMDEEVDRLSTIVGTLLTLTRIDVDPAGMQHQPVALQEVVETLVRRVGVVAAERGITVTAERLDPVTITGDATRLRQLFTNLLDNAVTYTPDGGRVSVRLESTREGARVQVSDTGIGIAPEHLPRIFERFYRADQAREQNTHGTGLGLAIARSVAQAHHGDIAVESTPGQGTTFIVTLPVHTRRRVHKVPLLHHVLPGGAVAR